MKKLIKRIVFSLIRDKVTFLIKEERLINKFLNTEQLDDLSQRHVEVQGNSIISGDSKIGNYTYIGYNTSISKSNVGNYCSIANNVSIGNGDHDPSKIATSSLFYFHPYKKLTLESCTIGNDVWIGVDAIIKRGVKIGNGVIIGANSFVNTDIPDFAIAVGSPARVLKYRFSKQKIEAINRSQWWDYELQEARNKIIEIENLKID